MTGSDIETRIKEKLCEIEKAENVTVLFAVESGSRAWGFASPDSDYDVRFVYRRNEINDYLKLEGIRDVIEWELNDVYDISGWDLDKTLKLVHASNPVIFEWAYSPIIYKETPFLEEFKEFIKPYFMTIKGAHHYLHMAEKNYEDYLTKESVKLKKYFYVLRPILATQYVLKYRTNPPMLFEELMEMVTDEQVSSEINKLLEAKKNTSELGTSEKIMVLNDYIEKELIRLNDKVRSLKKETCNWEELNRFFINTIR
ncbi:MAG: nucleotidyltransferase domain-containing protein [Erysipelotrichaceae bacterium]|nr:nucleotidyltransferase domain-containing protein [Erysipelotrichaceae bacterium]